MKKILVMLMAFAMVFSLFTVAASADDVKVLDIIWWTDGAETVSMQSLIDEYEAQHPDIKINLIDILSDYKGSNSTIWAICEKGSEMDKLDFEYKSHLNDYDENINVLNKIISDKTNTGIEGSKIDRDEYVRERTNQLTQKICELIEVCESEFKKNATYEAEINELTQRIQKREKENSEILNSNSWKMTENLRKIGKKFK